MSKKRKVLIFLLVFIMLEIVSRNILFYRNIWFSYEMNKDFYRYKGNFWDYVKEYKNYIINTKEKMNQVIVQDIMSRRRFYIPNLNINFYSMLDFKTNDFGMWERDINLKKENNTYRILCLGSSYTRTGYKDNTYTAILEKKLSEKYKDKTFEIINAGIPGIQILGSFMDFALDWRKLEPDMVIVENALDDMDTCISPFYLANYRKLRDRRDTVKGFIKQNIRKYIGTYALIDTLLSKPVKRFERPTSEGLTYYESILEALVLLAKGNGSKVVLLSCGITVDKDHNNDHDNPKRRVLEFRFPNFTAGGIVETIKECNRIMSKVAQRNKVLFFDMSDIVPKDNEHFVDATHRSDKGNEVYAEDLMNKLVASKVLEQNR